MNEMTMIEKAEELTQWFYSLDFIKQPLHETNEILAKELQSFAESYHAKKCAKCKAVMSDSGEREA